MIRRNLGLIVMMGFIFLLSASMQSQNGERTKFNFNSRWKLHVGNPDNAYMENFDDSSWKGVSLPYGWNEDEAFKKDIKELSTGIAWYRKEFQVPKTFDNQKVFIEFEGVRQAAEVYINGEYVGISENGVMAFGFDISDLIKYGNEKNVIAVKTDNSWDYREKSSNSRYQWNDKNFNANYGGITKNVFIHVTGPIYQTLPLYSNLETTGPYIYATDIDVKKNKAVVNAETEIKNESNSDAELQYEVVVEDLDGKVLKSFKGGKTKIEAGKTKKVTASQRIKNLKFWSWGYGYLYKVHTILKKDGDVIDKVTTRTGFRKTEFGDGLIKLNDRVFMVHGYAQRSTNEWPALGVNLPTWVSDFSNRLMVENNANTVRWMHITPSNQDVESCDRVGLIQAMPAGDSEGDVTGRRWEHRMEVMRDAIIYNRNNPSIIFYEGGNDGISEEHMQEVVDLRDQYDPYGGRAAGSREMLDSEIAEFGGEMLYINKSDDMPVWAMEYMRDEGLRKYWDEYTQPFHQHGVGRLYKGNDASAYHQNMDEFAKNSVKRWYEYFRERPGTGNRVSSGGVNIIFSETNTHHRGTQNYRLSGHVDAMRIPKDAFFAHQVMWNGWVDVEEHGSHIIGHWNYHHGVEKEVAVVSSGEKVELILNGESLGYGEKEHGFLFIFDKVKWEPGTLKAVSYDENGDEVDVARLQTAGKPERIKLTLRTAPNGVKADGTDLALVDVEVVDANGQRCPTSLDMINYELEGPAEWRGGIAQGPENFIMSKELPVEGGVSRVIVRSTTKPGRIKLTATSATGCLKPAEVTFDTKEVSVEGGLTPVASRDELPVYLEKGPTPETPSYGISRTSVNIVDVEAGSNKQSAENSFDGRQTTSWSNSGELENAWIEYELEKKAQVSEIALKLGGWRTSSYPIEVSSNGKVLFNGMTSPNLGFYYIEFKEPVEMENLKVRLIGEADFNKSEYKMNEMTNNAMARERQFNDTNRLNIAEIELFEFPEK